MDIFSKNECFLVNSPPYPNAFSPKGGVFQHLNILDQVIFGSLL